MAMHIEDDYIEKAERLLLPEGCHFDDERKAFINRFDSGDLLAVPGSGKTTALRAKLFCMAQNLPLNDERGILAISHTNVAVDELKSKLQSHCPQLFEYPNFVGTIQDFVDTFLALPYYVQKYGHKVEIIDADWYDQVCVRMMSSPNPIPTYLSRKLQYAKDFRKIRLGYNEVGRLILKYGLKGDEVVIEPEPKWEREKTSKQKVEQMMDFLYKMKESIMEYGVLHFDDCYFLADTYIRQYPQIVEILRKRFAYVFVDEAQDMQQHQLDLIDRCFNCDSVVLQRIGDPNQSIFDGFNIENSWECRNPSYINNSLRLTSEIASIVDHLVLDRGDNGHGGARFVVNGINKLSVPIRPYLLLYTWDKKDKLKEKFIEIIHRHNLNAIPEAKKYGFHIVGWNAEKSNNKDFRRLEDVFPEYNRKLIQPNSVPNTLSELIQQEKYYKNFAESRNGVLDAFVSVLRKSGQRAADGKLYNRSKVLTLVSEKEEAVSQIFQEELLEVTKILSAGKWSDAYNVLKSLLIKWLHDFCGIEPNDNVKVFLENNFVKRIDERKIEADTSDEVPITIGTVHSVKGMTHCATMYVETSYNNKYESGYMIEEKTTGRKPNKVTTITSPFFKQDLDVSGKNAAMAKRMLYVGFSRPTHLLCFVSDQSLWNEERLGRMQEAGWVIETIV